MPLYFRLTKTFFGLCILPLCWALGAVIFQLIFRSSQFALLFFAGFGISALITIFRYPAGRWYIFFHEITHVLWSFITVIPVKKIEMTGSGGHVEVEREHLLIALAPYFFPLTLFFFIIAHSILRIFGVSDLFIAYTEYVFFGALLGWHTVTSIQVIAQGQHEIERIGLFLSLSIIYVLFFFWTGLFISILIPDFYLADFFSLSYKKIITSYSHCFKIIFNGF